MQSTTLKQIKASVQEQVTARIAAKLVTSNGKENRQVSVKSKLAHAGEVISNDSIVWLPSINNAN